MASKLSRFLAELKRRKVYNVAAVYAAVGVAISIAVPDLFGVFGFPSWAAPLVIVVIAIGFPIALVLAWAYEVRPEEPPRREPAPEEGVSAGVPTRLTETPPVPTLGVPPSGVDVPDVADRKAVAVLPLTNLSGDPENEYFADGMTEDILTRLTRVRGLRVISRTSAMQYKNTAKNVRDIAAELGVEAVVEGSVRRSEGRVRIAAQLIDAQSDDHLWADVFDREIQDVFAIQSEVAEQIASALETELSDAERIRVRGAPTENLDAYELCLRGRHEEFQISAEHLQRAVDLLHRAIELDPTYAVAHAYLAEAFVWLAYWGRSPPSTFWPQAREAADRAVTIDDELAEAFAALGAFKLHFEWDWPGVEQALERAISLNPSCVDAFLWRSLYCSMRERHSEAMRAIQEAQSLDPLSSYFQAMAGLTLACAGRHEEALSWLEKLTERDPGFMLGHFHLGIVYHWLGRLEEALRCHKRASELSGQDPLSEACLAVALADTGDIRSARERADSVIHRAEQEYVSPEALAVIASGFGDEETALGYIEKAVQEHSPFVLWFRVIPSLIDLWGESPRFLALMKQIWPDDEFGWETS